MAFPEDLQFAVRYTKAEEKVYVLDRNPWLAKMSWSTIYAEQEILTIYERGSQHSVILIEDLSHESLQSLYDLTLSFQLKHRDTSCLFGWVTWHKLIYIFGRVFLNLGLNTRRVLHIKLPLRCVQV